MCEFIPFEIARSRMYKHILWYIKGGRKMDEMMKNYNKKVTTKEEFYSYVAKFLE